MHLTNATDAVAMLQVVDLMQPERRAAAIIKKTYKLLLSGALAPDNDQVPLIADQLEVEFGVMHGEIYFRKRGVDVCVLGSARFQKPVTRGRVRIEVGDWAHELEVVGDSVWRRNAVGDLAPSAPIPFQEMPLSYARAFGGAAEVNGESVPWTDNPSGCGYYETPEQALGKPLPNIQPLTGPALTWDYRMPVVGWAPYPMYWGLRAARAVTLDSKVGEILDVSPELFNHAHPDLILGAVNPGARVRVLGVGAQPFAFAVPRECPRVEVHVGQTVSEAVGGLDGLFIWPDAARLVVTWRARFRYPVRSEEVRFAELKFTE